MYHDVTVDLYGDDDLDLSTQLAINIDAQTESTHDTPLTLCCSGGHDELVQVLLARGADLEHRDKKGGVVRDGYNVCIKNFQCFLSFCAT